MPPSSTPRWLNWCQRLQAIAQTGLTFARDPYDRERYEALREIAVEMLAAGSDAEPAVIRDLLAAETGYATPKVDVRAVVFREDRLLFVRERSDGCWTLPGGWADVAASPAENVVREVREESGYEVRADRLLAVYDRSLHPHEPPFPFHIYKLFMLCTLVGGAPAATLETDDVGFFGEHELPELSLTRITRGQVLRMFEHHRQPGLPADFDPAT